MHVSWVLGCVAVDVRVCGYIVRILGVRVCGCGCEGGEHEDVCVRVACVMVYEDVYDGEGVCVCMRMCD